MTFSQICLSFNRPRSVVKSALNNSRMGFKMAKPTGLRKKERQQKTKQRDCMIIKRSFVPRGELRLIPYWMLLRVNLHFVGRIFLGV